MSTDTREALAALPMNLQFSAEYLRGYMEGELDEARRHLEKLIAALATQPAQAVPISYHRDDETEQGERCYVQLIARLDEKGRQVLANEVAHGARADLATDGAVILSRKDWSGVKILRAAAQPSAQGEAVAWKLVPVEPTEAMVKAGEEADDDNIAATPYYAATAIYRAMLASAPAAPAQAVALTDEQIWSNDEIMAENAKAGLMMLDLVHLVRAIERAHGIAPKATKEKTDE